MAVSKLALGMNARNYLYMRALNGPKAIARADNKLATKERLIEKGIPTTPLIAVFRAFRKARSYPWGKLRGDFVLKPAHGYGGAGITIVRDWNGATGINSSGEQVTARELEAEIFGILDGAHSLHNISDHAFLEGRVVVSRTLRKLSHGGVPDIRVIVYSGIPIMAMLRMPTEESHGKANLHQGAVGIGIDMRTGITTQAIQYRTLIDYIPNTDVKVRGIKIPQWDRVLQVAVDAHNASDLGYSGIDIVLDETSGPLVLEVNARPGLQIQLANGASLRTRLERVEGMTVPNNVFAIDLAKRMFAEHDLAHVTEASNIIGYVESVTVYGPKGSRTVHAKIDTGAFRSAIDARIAEEIGLDEAVVDTVRVRNALGMHRRTMHHASFRLRGEKIDTIVSIIDRTDMRFPMIIGRRDLKGFLVDPTPIASFSKNGIQ